MIETPKYMVWYNAHGGKMYPVLGIQINRDGSWTVNATTDYDSWNPVQTSGKWKVGYLMQFVGIKDKHDREIYEGDIVDCGRYRGKEIYRVIIKDIRNLPLEMFGSNLDFLFIVGNIFENKDKVPEKIYADIVKVFEVAPVPDA